MNQNYVRQLDGNLDLGRGSIYSKLHIDPVLLAALLALSIIGLFILYSASGQSIEMVTRQGVYLAVGFLLMIVIAQFPPYVFMQWSTLMYVIGIILLILVLIAGLGAKGAQRWIGVSSFRFQPSELMKLIMPLVLASYLSRHQIPPRYKQIFFSLIIIGVPAILIAKQPDLGTSILISASGFFVLLVAGLHWRPIFAAFILALPMCWGMWHFMMHDYQRQRVLTFLRPENDPWGAGWNIIQAKIAIGSGGLTGKGWLQGTQSHLDFLPESHTDFIIAVFAEEFGFINALLLFTLYIFIISRMLYITLQSNSLFGRLLCASIALTFFVYLLVNIGMVSGLLPVVGVPLPLVSRGGTSILAIMAGFGFVMSVHTHKSLLGR